MSKQRPRRVGRPQITEPSRQRPTTSGAGRDSSHAVATRDSYTNPMARLGFGQPNLLEQTEYPLTRMTQNYALINSLYRNDWIAKRIIDTIPEDMVKNWYEITSQVSPDQTAALSAVERRTHIRQRILEGLRWGRLYGGAAGIIIIDGQEDMLHTPLDLRMVMPGQFKGLIIADRWNGIYPGNTLVQDINDPDFGTPDVYRFALSETEIAQGITVHHSRVVRFVSNRLPYVERVAEQYWDTSELEHVYTELNKRNTTSANIANLIFQANLKTMKVGDLGQMLTSVSPQVQRDIYSRLMISNYLMNSMGINLMDREDDFQTHQYTFAGLSDIYETFMLDIAGASRIPVTKLFGRSPAGMNATGESDINNYYDEVHQKQESDLRPVIEKLLPVICMSTWGAVPDDLDFRFKPIRDTSDEERANLIQQSAAAITSVYQAGIISQRSALKELRQSGMSYGMWSNITDEDIEKADDGAEPMDELSMGGPMEGGAAGEQAGQAVPAGGADGPIDDAQDGTRWNAV